jgi:agmatine deiminase
VQDDEGALGLVDFNFNGWGDKQEHRMTPGSPPGGPAPGCPLPAERAGRRGAASRWTATAPPS